MRPQRLRRPSRAQLYGQLEAALLGLAVAAFLVICGVVMLRAANPSKADAMEANASYVMVQNLARRPLAVHLTSLDHRRYCGQASIGPGERARLRICGGYYAKLRWGPSEAEWLAVAQGRVYGATYAGAWRLQEVFAQ